MADSKQERRIQDFLSKWMADHKVPGASVAVVKDGELLYAEGFGSRDLETNEPATAETVYGAGSVSKTVTAIAIMQLQENGHLNVDDSVSDHIDCALTDAHEDITIHHLLTHTSGIPGLCVSGVLLTRLTGAEPKTADVPLGDGTDLDIHWRGAVDEVTGPPGERYMYCNSGYALLGRVIEACTGQSYVDYVEENILTPLEMDRSTFLAEEFESFTDRLTPYTSTDEGVEATEMPIRELSYPNGGLMSSVRDLTRLVRLFTSTGTTDGGVLTSESLTTMSEAHVTSESSWPYGYGLGHSSWGDRTLIGHDGSVGVSTAYVGFTDDFEYGVALAANSTGCGPDIAKGILAALFGEVPDEAVPYFARKRRFERLSGEYEAYRGLWSATVEPSDDYSRLELTVADWKQIPLFPVHQDAEEYRFFTPNPSNQGGKEYTEFDVEPNGDVDLYYGRNLLHKVR